MKFLRILNKLSDWWRGLPADDPTLEAKSQRLNKSAKIQTGLEAVLMDSISELARQDHEQVRIHRNRAVFGDQRQETIPKRGTDGSDEMIIADDIKVNNIKPSNTLPAMLIGAAICAAGWWLSKDDAQPNPQPQPGVNNTTKSDYTVQSRVILPHE